MDVPPTPNEPTRTPRPPELLDYGLRKYPGPFRRPWRRWAESFSEVTMVILGCGVIVAVMWASIAVQQAEDDRARGITRGIPRRGAAVVVPGPASQPIFAQLVEEEFDRPPSQTSPSPLPQAIEDAQRVLEPLRSRGLIEGFWIQNSEVTAVAGPRFDMSSGDEKHLTLGALRNWGQAKSAQVRLVTILDAPNGRVIARSEPAAPRPQAR